MVCSVNDLLRVDGHRDGGVCGDVPAVEEELQGHLEMLDDSVGVEEDDELVVAEHLSEYVRLDPGVPVAFDLLRVEELVVVAVDLG